MADQPIHDGRSSARRVDNQYASWYLRGRDAKCLLDIFTPKPFIIFIRLIITWWAHVNIMRVTPILTRRSKHLKFFLKKNVADWKHERCWEEQDSYPRAPIFLCVCWSTDLLPSSGMLLLPARKYSTPINLCASFCRLQVIICQITNLHK